MTEEMKALLCMIKKLITGDSNTNIKYETLDWSEMFSLACRNNMAPFFV